MRVVAWLIGFALLSAPLGAEARSIVFLTGQIDSITFPDQFLVVAQQTLGMGTTVTLADLRPGASFEVVGDFNDFGNGLQVSINGKRFLSSITLPAFRAGDDQLVFLVWLQDGDFGAQIRFAVPIPPGFSGPFFEGPDFDPLPTPNTLSGFVSCPLCRFPMDGMISGRVLQTRVVAPEPAGLAPLGGIALAGLAWVRARRAARRRA